MSPFTYQSRSVYSSATSSRVLARPRNASASANRPWSARADAATITASAFASFEAPLRAEHLLGERDGLLRPPEPAEAVGDQVVLVRSDR